jgi:hypothetical protein
MNNEDTLARVYFVDLCTILSTDSKVQANSSFFQSICQNLLDKNDRVCFEAILGLTKHPWGLVATSTVRTEGEDVKKVLDIVLARLKVGLEGVSIPLVHAACRVTRYGSILS